MDNSYGHHPRAMRPGTDYDLSHALDDLSQVIKEDIPAIAPGSHVSKARDSRMCKLSGQHYWTSNIPGR